MEFLLVVDDDPVVREQLQHALKRDYQVLLAKGPEQARSLLAKGGIALALIDLHLPPDADTPRQGLALISWIRETGLETVAVAITGSEEARIANAAIEMGAYDFFSKPIDLVALRLVLNRALYRKRIEEENRRLRHELTWHGALDRCIGKSAAMQKLFDLVRKVADSEASIFLGGESGTGKELIARAIHSASRRRDGPFVALSCAALPSDLLESELFGHERGAFTGAVEAKPGRLEAAHTGTLFLDEVGDIPLGTQVKLLRVLQERAFERLGGNRTITSDFRLLSASLHDLDRLVAAGKFREDLLFRLKVVTIWLPPLRDRRDDIPLLVRHFIDVFARKSGRNVTGICPEAEGVLLEYHYPGNVRELENLVERAVALADGDRIRLDDLPANLAESHRDPGPRVSLDSLGRASLKEFLDAAERRLLAEALGRASGVKAEAARLLGVQPDQVKYLCRKHRID